MKVECTGTHSDYEVGDDGVLDEAVTGGVDDAHQHQLEYDQSQLVAVQHRRVESVLRVYIAYATAAAAQPGYSYHRQRSTYSDTAGWATGRESSSDVNPCS